MLLSPVVSVKDTTTFTLKKADLTVKRIGEAHVTSQRDVPCSDGLRWWVKYYPAGRDEGSRNHLSVYLYVNKTVSVNYSFTINNSSINHNYTYDFLKPEGYGAPQYAFHETLRPLFVSGQLSITCKVEFEVSVPFSLWAPRLAQHSDHVPTDFELVVGPYRLQVHKSLLSLMSPVFHAMLSHDTAESETGKVEIMDFDFETVKMVVDFCYGRLLTTPSVENVVSMLRFADKYDIKAVTDQLENIPRSSLSISTFGTIVQYAYDCSKDDLFAECVKFFKDHEGEIKKLQDFVNLPLPIIVNILKSAFDLKTYFDVFRHARDNDYGFILKHLENLVSVSLDTFFIAVSYAWQYAQDGLKTKCAAFFNANQEALMSMKAVVDLPPEILHGVVKLGLELKTAIK